MTTTLDDWLADCRRQGTSDSLAAVVRALASAAADLSAALRTAPLQGYADATETRNVHGETQKALDVLANDIFVGALRSDPAVRTIVSEEEDEPISFDNPGAQFGVSLDPLDGSSNADVNMTIGSIFSIHDLGPNSTSLLRPGRDQVAAGFVSYGPATTLVLTFGKTVALFQLSPGENTFRLVNGALVVPRATREYAINSARASHWDEVIAQYISERVAGAGGPLAAAYNMRWTASMVADVQRILTRGGVFLYPADAETRHLGGRLRLLYEAAPMAMIVEAAGGRATTGMQDLLDVVPQHAHQKVPVILGSADEIELLIAGYSQARWQRRDNK